MKNSILLFFLAASTACFGQLNLPVDFESTTLDYGLTDFGGSASQIITDPTDAGNKVVETIRTAGAETYAGTTVGGTVGFDTAIPFDSENTIMSVRIWSPTAGLPMRMKVENSTDPGVSVETETISTVAMGWETVMFDFAVQAPGTAAINFGSSYNKASVFFNFNQPTGTSVEQTFYWDDMTFVGGTGGGGGDPFDLPITFEGEPFGFNDFAGTATTIVVDPTDPNNMVGRTVRSNTAEVYAGTVPGGPLANPVPFSEGNTMMSVRVWSPNANTPVRLKVETAGGGPATEAETTTTVAMEWETLVIDFSNPVEGQPALDLNANYNQLVIFFNFGTTGADAGEQIYFWDDLAFGDGSVAEPFDLPITFEGDPFGFTDFAGTATTIVVDPTDPNNMVGQTVRSNTADVFAGTVPGAGPLANPVPFSAGNTTMSVRVWAPNANTPVRLKVETAGGGPATETETTTTVAMQWETLVFDFNNPATGQPALDFNANYDQLVIFFNFGTLGSDAGEQVYFWDDLAFGGTVSVEEVSSNSNISVYPNPANDHFLVSFADGNIDKTTLSLMDMTGRVVERINVVNTMTRVETNTLAAGQYILRIDTADKAYAQKVLVTK